MDSNRLSQLRDENNITQNEVAEFLNIRRVSISNWERGTEIIPIRKLNDLSNYYKVSMDYILKLSNNKTEYIGPSELDKKTIGNNIKKFRKENNLTLRDLAKELNTSSSTISAYETGKTLLLTAFAYQICKTYNISMDDLYGRTKQTKNT